MAKQRNAFKAGLFIIVSIIGAFAVVVGIKGIGTYLDPREERYVTFTLQDDLSGLNVGDDVRVGGFKVGEVRKIEVVPPDDVRLGKRASGAKVDDQMLLVSFLIPKRYEFHDGARIGIQATVTGQACINIDSLGSRAKPKIDQEVALVGRPSAFSALMNTIEEVKPKITGILTQVNDDTLPHVTAIAKSVRETTVPTFNNALKQIDAKTIPTLNDTLTSAKSDIGEILFNIRTNTIPGANATLASFKNTSDHVTDLVDEVRGYVKPTVEKIIVVGDSARGVMDELKDVLGDSKTDLRGALANLNAASATIKESLPQTMEQLNQALANLRGILADNRPHINGIISSAHATTDTLKHATAELRRSPWRLLWRPNPDDEKNLTIFETARQFADGAADLKQAADTLQSKLNDNKTSNEEVKAMLVKMRASFDNFQAVEKRLWEQVKE